MYSKAFDSKIDYLWLNICDSDDMENVSSVTSSVTTAAPKNWDDDE